jgi:hypothetical protein
MCHFYTGLFCIECSVILKYIELINIYTLINNMISIEYNIYDFFIHYKINYSSRPKINLIRFDNATGENFI